MDGKDYRSLTMSTEHFNVSVEIPSTGKLWDRWLTWRLGPAVTSSTRDLSHCVAASSVVDERFRLHHGHAENASRISSDVDVV